MSNPKQTDLENATDAIGDALLDFYYAEGFDAIPNAHDIVMGACENQGLPEDVSYEVYEKIAQAKIDA